MEENSGDEDGGQSFGQEVPPLVHLLKDILERYPEGGQILKELIQNADDAGATEVKFLLDARPDAYGTDRLVRKSLREYQGVALYAQNNAVFQEEDWKSIQKPYRSVKKDDPMKVGKFGIGFNSIYHLTDLPSVVSGNQIGFFDPHQKHFSRGETGRRFSFEKARDPKFSDQFSTYNVLGCSLSKSKYDGTLFRFPLRQKPSPNLCSTVCTPDRIRELFRSFQTDAHLVLLFLKTVEVISIYEWLPGMSKPHEVFSVGLSGRTRMIARQERQDLLRKVTAATDLDGSLKSGCTVSEYYQAEITCKSQRTVPISQTWLIENHISTVNSKVHAMGKKLAQIPWVGLAVPIGEKTEHAEGLGRIFCFLPLPPSADADSNTGLPVHVHGSFSVADNRRSLKWPADDRVKDEKAVWNRLLTEHLLTEAYVNLIQHATLLGTDLVPVQDVYAMWPDMQHVQHQWKQYMIPLFLKSVAQLKVLYGVEASESCWKQLAGVLISDKAQDHLSLDESVAMEVLKRMSYHIAFPPVNVTSCLKEIARKHGVSSDRVSPAIVRNALKKNSYYQRMTRHKKIQLLKYVLQDHSYSSLNGLHLLPLADNTFTAFSSFSGNIYMESVECPRSLFPGLNAKFLDESIDAGVYKTLNKAVVSGGTQLKAIQPTHVPSLISEVLSLANISSRTYIVSKPKMVNGLSTDSWIENLWLWINQHIGQVSLDNFQNMFIIPVTSAREERKLMKLTTELPAIYASLPRADIQINKKLARGLEALGCTVLCDPPDFLTSCNQLHTQDTYICRPAGILACISRGGCSGYDLLEQVQRRELAAVVSAVVHVCFPSSSEQELIYQLPLFRERGCNSFTSLSRCNQVAPAELPESLPIKASLIASPSMETQPILNRISSAYYCQLCVDEVYSKIVFQQFEKHSAQKKGN
jgi:sacsin